MRTIFKRKLLIWSIAGAILFIPTLVFSQTPKKLKLVWHDEFDYTGLPDPSKWQYETGFVRNREPQYYTNARLQNCRVENGMLVIEALKEPFKGPAKPGNAKDTVATYTSASIHTNGINTWKYGRIEVRAKVPKGMGSWSAAWLLGIDRGRVKWPDCGEIDLMEYVGKDSTRVYGTVHYADSTGHYQSQGKKAIAGNPYDDFHIYAIDWDQDHIDFYYDQTKYFSFNVKDAQAGSSNIFQKKFYLLLNLALGRAGTLGGPLDDKILPMKYLVDYVRVYQ